MSVREWLAVAMFASFILAILTGFPVAWVLGGIAVLFTAIAIIVALTLSVPGLAYLADHGLDLSGIGGMSFAGMAFDPVWRGVVTPWVIIGPVLTLVFIVSVSVLYPALKAARISPVEAMRYQ